MLGCFDRWKTIPEKQDSLRQHSSYVKVGGIGRKHRLWVFFSGLMVSFTVFVVVFFPVFTKQDEQGVVSELSMDAGDGSVLGDIDPPAYDYWYAPQDSFGISSMKTVNWSTFWSLNGWIVGRVRILTTGLLLTKHDLMIIALKK